MIESAAQSAHYPKKSDPRQGSIELNSQAKPSRIHPRVLCALCGRLAGSGWGELPRRSQRSQRGNGRGDAVASDPFSRKALVCCNGITKDSPKGGYQSMDPPTPKAGRKRLGGPGPLREVLRIRMGKTSWGSGCLFGRPLAQPTNSPPALKTDWLCLGQPVRWRPIYQSSQPGIRQTYPMQPL
jgi:hypothetical protein